MVRKFSYTFLFNLSFSFLATSLCLNERLIYTDNILGEVIQNLIEITPIPLLFMRTVLQTLNLYPKMIHFIINILQQLIKKQVSIELFYLLIFIFNRNYILDMETNSNMGWFYKML